MPGFVLHSGASVLCAHGGIAQPVTPFPRVTVGGMPVVTMTSTYTITGCGFVPSGGNGPCTSGQWTVAATRVFAGGAPVVINTGLSICIPTGTPLNPVATQTRVTAL